MRVAGLASVCAAAGCGRVDFEVEVVARLEAEAGLITSPFRVELDDRASGGMYVFDGNSTGLAGPGDVVLSFAVPETDTYYVWGRTLAPTTAVDSFFVQIDNGPSLNYQTTDCITTEWNWVALTDPVNCPAQGAEVPHALASGAHGLRLMSREGGSAVDAILIVRDPLFDPPD